MNRGGGKKKGKIPFTALGMVIDGGWICRWCDSLEGWSAGKISHTKGHS